MRLVKLDSEDGPVYVNPEHVVAVRKALKNTHLETVSGQLSVIGDPAQIARQLGAEELQIEISSPKRIDAGTRERSQRYDRLDQPGTVMRPFGHVGRDAVEAGCMRR